MPNHFLTALQAEEIKKLLYKLSDDWSYPMDVRDHAHQLRTMILKAERERQQKETRS